MKYPGDDKTIVSGKGVALISGGIDSTVMLELAKRYGWECVCLSVDYGQSHVAELRAAKVVAEHYGYEHVATVCDIRSFVPSRLTGLPEAVPRTLEEVRKEDVPSPALVPGRNTIFLSLAMALAQSRKIDKIFIGGTLEDQAGFADFRRPFFNCFEAVTEFAAGVRMEVISPLISMRKVDVVRVGIDLRAPLEQTLTCYYPFSTQGFGGPAPVFSCGRCDACMIRKEAFEQLGKNDPARYR